MKKIVSIGLALILIVGLVSVFAKQAQGFYWKKPPQSTTDNRIKDNLNTPLGPQQIPLFTGKLNPILLNQ